MNTIAIAPPALLDTGELTCEIVQYNKPEERSVHWPFCWMLCFFMLFDEILHKRRGAGSDDSSSTLPPPYVPDRCCFIILNIFLLLE